MEFLIPLATSPEVASYTNDNSKHHHMSQLTPSTVRESVVKNAHDRITRVKAMASSVEAADIELKLAIVILVAEILGDVETLVTEPLFQKRKRELHAFLARVTACKDNRKLAAIIKAFSENAMRILPSTLTFDPENPPW